ncbi:hypothetical protein L7F22_064419 [Adiantum nelumboides]|nr:hypothetical protein [Adiantum nelumboides]
MADNNEEGRINVDNFDFVSEGANDDTPMLVNYLLTRLQQAMTNLTLEVEVQQQLHAYAILPTHQEERDPVKSLGETFKRGLSMVREGENHMKSFKMCYLKVHIHQREGAMPNVKNLHQKRRKEANPLTNQWKKMWLLEGVKYKDIPTKRKRSPHSPPHHESKKEEKDSKKKKERKRSPSSPSSSPSSSSDENDGYSSNESPSRGHRRSHAAWRRSNKLKKLKEGGKSISFLTYKGEGTNVERDAEVWLETIDNYFKAAGTHPQNQTMLAMFRLTGDTKIWWKQHYQDFNIVGTSQSWEEIKDAVTACYLPPAHIATKINEFSSLQRLSSTLEEDYSKFVTLRRYAPKMTLELQVARFCQGLIEPLNNRLEALRPTTLQDALLRAKPKLAKEIKETTQGKQDFKDVQTKQLG